MLKNLLLPGVDPDAILSFIPGTYTGNGRVVSQALVRVGDTYLLFYDNSVQTLIFLSNPIGQMRTPIDVRGLGTNFRRSLEDTLDRFEAISLEAIMADIDRALLRTGAAPGFLDRLRATAEKGIR